MKKLFIVPLLLAFVINASAQRNELGVFLGTSYYLGDLNPSKHFLLTKPAGGIIYRYVFNPRWALRMNGLYGTVEGDDAVAKFNEARNLRFKSHIFEMSAQLELNFLPYVTGNKEENYFSPYIFAGISVFSFNPKAEYEGTWWELKSLCTEGQGTSIESAPKPYSITNVSFPFGLGFKYSIGKNICIGAEWGLRKTVTDYLDDVSTTYADPERLGMEKGPIAAALSDRSDNYGNNTGLQRGNSGTKDWYAFAGGFITFKFKMGKDNGCPGIGNKHYKFKEYFKKD
ncbi:MAG: DUF6089 family protein [Bacteroidota bacterium]